MTHDAAFSSPTEIPGQRHANRGGYSRHRPALPLDTREGAEASPRSLAPEDFGRDLAPAKGVSARFTRAGHIVGSSCLTLQIETESVSFSGDVGRPVDPIMRPPGRLPASDTLVVESTYADRRHPEEAVSDALAHVVCETADRRGTILVPAFAVGRAQHLLHLLTELRLKGRIPELPVFVDSPMAIDATQIFCRHTDDHRLSEDQCNRLCQLGQYTRTPEESKASARGR